MVVVVVMIGGVDVDVVVVVVVVVMVTAMVVIGGPLLLPLLLLGAGSVDVDVDVEVVVVVVVVAVSVPSSHLLLLLGVMGRGTVLVRDEGTRPVEGLELGPWGHCPLLASLLVETLWDYILMWRVNTCRELDLKTIWVGYADGAGISGRE